MYSRTVSGRSGGTVGGQSGTVPGRRGRGRGRGGGRGRGSGSMTEATSPLLMPRTLLSTLTPPSSSTQPFSTPTKPMQACLTPKATMAKTPTAPMKTAKSKSKSNLSVVELKELRDKARAEQGHASDVYQFWKDRLQYVQKCERNKPIEKRDWNLTKEMYRSEVSLDKPQRVVISESHIYSGVRINYVGGVPIREEALALGCDNFTKIEEGGILKVDPKYAVQMSVDKRNKGVHMIGGAFGKLSGEPFSYNDAKVTRDLLFGNGDGCKDSETIVMYITYVYYNKKKGYHVEQEAGIMIFTPHTVKKPNGKCHSMKLIKVAHLVQFCIEDSLKSRGLGKIALEDGIKMLKDLYEFDFVSLFGCYRPFYEKICNMKCNPKWFDCPFNLESTKEENEAKFFYDILDQPLVAATKWGPKTRFERNIVEVFDKHNKNVENEEDKQKFTLGFKAKCLYAYYQIDQMEGPFDTAEMLAALNPHDNNENNGSIGNVTGLLML